MAQRPLRADAQRSRQHLISAATEVFLRDGAGGSLEEIARRAGVGSATLHRHFASRWELIDAVFADRVQDVCSRAIATARDSGSAEGLVLWLHAVLGYFTQVRGLAAAVLHATEDHRSCEVIHQMLADAGGPLLARAVAAGAVRADISVGDLLALVGAAALAGEHDPAGGERLLGLALEGIGPR